MSAHILFQDGGCEWPPDLTENSVSRLM